MCGAVISRMAVPVLLISVVFCLFCQNYLKKFGYIDTQRRSGLDSVFSISKAVTRLQKQLGLKETGELDKATLESMKQPRCGVPDVANYATFEGDLKWDHNDITYRWAKATVDHINVMYELQVFSGDMEVNIFAGVFFSAGF